MAEKVQFSKQQLNIANQNPIKKKNGCLKAFLIGIGILFLFGLIGRMCESDTKKDSDANNANKDTSTSTVNNQAIRLNTDSIDKVNAEKVKALKSLFVENKDEFENDIDITCNSHDLI